MKGFVIIVGVLVVAGGYVQLRQWQQREELRTDIMMARDRANELASLRAERGRLVATQVPAAELERLRGDREAIARLRAEIETLKQRAQALPPATPANEPPASGSAEPAPTVMQGTIAEKYLRNMGRATPTAALETAFWAATGGDVDTLVGLIALEGDARVAAEKFFAALPAESRGQYRSPEHLVAFLTAKDIPLSGIQIRPPRKEDPAGTKVVAQVPAPDGKYRMVSVSLRQYGSDWKLVVPHSAVEKYARTLAVPGPHTAGR